MTAPTMARDAAADDEAPRGDRTAAVAARRGYAVTLVVTGALGLLAAWVITADKLRLLEAKVDGTSYTPACSLNPIVSCGNVMESAQAEAFGFPNPMLGLVTYPVVLSIGVAALAGAAATRTSDSALVYPASDATLPVPKV